MADSIFTKIINRELPGHFVYEDDVCIVILDIFPRLRGQSLVIPKVQEDYIFKLDDKTYQHILAIAKRVALASDKLFNTLRTCVIIEGFDVPHTHIKLYPITPGEEPLGKHFAMGEEADHEELAALATELRNTLESLE